MQSSNYLVLLENLVGGTGIEHVNPTMSRQASTAKSLINKERSTSKFALCSLYIHGKSGQSRPIAAKENRIKSCFVGAILCLLLASDSNLPPATASDATSLVVAAAKRHRVPVDLAVRVGRAESGLQCHRHNRSGASGPLQIMPSTARAMGYRGPSIRRASCAVQTEWGMRHLAMCYRGAKGDRRIAAACHYQGVSALRRVSKAGAAYARRVAR